MSKVADILQKLLPIAEQFVTQDIQGTADAVFVVYDTQWSYNAGRKREGAVRYWETTQHSRIVDESVDLDDLFEALEMLEEKHGRESYVIGGVAYTAAYKVAEYHAVDGAVFFTKKGAEQYIERHKDDLSDPFVFVEVARHNDEWKLVRELLTALAEEARPRERPLTKPHREWALEALRLYFLKNLASDSADGSSFDNAVLDALSSDSIFEDRVSDAPRPELREDRKNRLQSLREHYSRVLLESGEEDIQTVFDVAVLDALSDKNIFGGGD